MQGGMVFENMMMTLREALMFHATLDMFTHNFVDYFITVVKNCRE